MKVSNSICELSLNLPVFSIGPSFLPSAEPDNASVHCVLSDSVSAKSRSSEFCEGGGWVIGYHLSAWKGVKGKDLGASSSYRSVISFPGGSPMPHSCHHKFLALLVLEPLWNSAPWIHLLLAHHSRLWFRLCLDGPVIFPCSSVFHLPKFCQYLWGGICLSPVVFLFVGFIPFTLQYFPII